jgi:pSer/pThr/pTyr-binding forkhead associated (FHA) protein
MIEAHISVLAGPFAGQNFALTQAKFLIGREDDCHMQIEEEFVSRHHCVLLLDDYVLRVRDLGSKNGTFINGQRLTSSEQILNSGDLIKLGTSTFLAKVGPGSEMHSSCAMTGDTTSTHSAQVGIPHDQIVRGNS